MMERPYRRLLLPPLLAGLVLLAACAPAPVPESAPAPAAPGPAEELDEKPVPDGNWREHRLAGCAEDVDVPTRVERYLGLCSEYFRDGSGSDAMIEMEMGLAAGHRHSLMLLTLGQLYLMAGQGQPELLPAEGPAADTGDWDRNQERLLRRARQLLEEARKTRPDDAAVDYLLADVHRAAGDAAAAERAMAAGLGKCTGGRSFRILRQYQLLNRYPAKYAGGPSPVYPPAAARDGVAGDVVLDLLLDPRGAVRQVVVVESPSGSLAEAAARSLRAGEFEVARIGKYPVWSWLRVTTAFNLGD
jgi:TonB family protein